MAKNSDKKVPVFIVEDNEAWSSALAGKIGKKYEAQIITTGEEAAEKLLAYKPEIIILDYHLEGQWTGLDTLKEIRKKLPNCTVIMFSAQDDVQTAIDILENGAYDYIVKNDNALNRLKIVLRNLEEAHMLRSEMVELRFRMKRERFALTLVIIGIVIMSVIIWLNTCPSQRVVKWDPFGVEASGQCPEMKTVDPPK